MHVILRTIIHYQPFLLIQTFVYLHVVKEWSHQSVLHKYAFRSSLVLPTMTAGGATSVRMASNTHATPTITPIRRRRYMSDIFTAFADRTWNITDILGEEDCVVSSKLT